MLKVLLLSHSDVHGGAARAALRLHRALLSQGSDSRFFLGKRFLNEPGLIGSTSRLSHCLSDYRSYSALLLRLIHKTGNHGLHSYNLFPSGLAKKINAMDIDVVNLHWPHRELLSIREIGNITHPIVWTMHDQWAIAGAAHYEEITQQEQIISGYDDRPINGWPDIDRWTWRRKHKCWRDRNISLVGPSRWMTEYAKSSPLPFSPHVKAIPNCLDTDIFKPRDKRAAREKLGLPLDKPLVMTAALSVDGDPRKGFTHLRAAMNLLHERSPDVELIIVGSVTVDAKNAIKTKSHALGTITGEEELAWVYAAADVFLITSEQENLPNTVLEAISCGIPAVGFDVGGIGELIQHKITGALVPAFDVSRMADSISWVITENGAGDLSSAARMHAASHYAPEIVAKKYLEFFELVTTQKLKE